MDRVRVDFPKTCGKGIYLGVEPKLVPSDKNNPKSEQVQARDANNVPKWTVTIAVRSLLSPKAKMENIMVTLSSPTKPYTAISVGQAVIVDELEMGVMKQDRGGFSVFFSAENIRPAAPERAASGQ